MSTGSIQLAMQRIQEIESRISALAARNGNAPVDANNASDPADFSAILSQAQAAEGGNVPDPTGLMAMIQNEALEQGMDPALVKAVVKNESGFNPQAVSSVGAQGLMQLMPGTAKGLGVTDSFDPEQNVAGGTKYLKGLIQKFDSVPLGVAAYNAGPGAVEHYGGIPPYAETKNYVKKVIESYEAYKTPERGAARNLAENQARARQQQTSSQMADNRKETR